MRGSTTQTDETKPQFGEVAFLFTDIENSTRLWERHPSLMQEAISQHNSAVEDAAAEVGGRVLKYTGDGTFSVFRDVDAAISAARRIQGSRSHVKGIEVAVRTGIHMDQGDFDAADHFGRGVNLCARITDAAHGGQILLSEEAAGATSDLEDVDLIDLGLSRLRGIAKAQRLYQLVVPELRASFPPLVSQEDVPKNLPKLRPLIGRDKDVQDLEQALGRSSLVTITGAGGVGKTTLAVDVSRRRLERYPDGVWFVDLSVIPDDAFIAPTLAEVLGVSERTGSSPESAIIDFLATRHVLLVIDNCEHVLEGTAHLIHSILRSTSDVAILATSREPVGIAEETLFRVDPLEVPTETAETLDLVRSFASAQLFIERGRAALRTFEPTDKDVPTITAICRRLDGIPLALEIAAAQLRNLPLNEIVTHLDSRVGGMQGFARSAVRRQRTLDAAISWGYDLLSERQRQLLRTVSTFSSGFNLQMVREIAAHAGFAADAEGGVLDLVDKNLVTLTSDEHLPYRVLETIRMYCRVLSSQTDEVARLHVAHLDWALQELIEAHDKWPDVADSIEAIEAIERMQSEYRAALSFCVSSRRFVQGLQMADRLSAYWSQRAPGDPKLWYPLLIREGIEVPDELLCTSLIKWGREVVVSDVATSVDALERAIGIARGSVPRLRALALHYLARSYWQLDGEPSRAKPLLIEAIDLASPDRPSAACFDLVFLTLAECAEGNGDEAVAVAKRAVEVAVGPLRHPSHAHEAMAQAMRLNGEIAPAAEQISLALPIYTQLKMSACLPHGLECAAAILADAGRLDDARKALLSADSTRRSVGAESHVWEDFVRDIVLGKVEQSWPSNVDPSGFDVEAAVEDVMSSLTKIRSEGSLN